MGHKISKDEADAFVSREGQTAEQETRGHYNIDLFRQGHAGAEPVYRLHDMRKRDSAGIPKTVFEGSEEECNRQLDKRARSARTRAENDARDRIDSFHRDIEMGFYDDIPQAAGTEKAKILGASTQTTSSGGGSWEEAVSAARMIARGWSPDTPLFMFPKEALTRAYTEIALQNEPAVARLLAEYAQR